MNQSDAVHTRLRAAVLGLELSPGEAISERGLETAFAASRTPVRAALSRLEGEGLVRRSGRGWVVSPLDLAEVVHAVELREALETAAIAAAVSRADDRRLDELLSIAEREADGADDGVRRGEEFHVALAALTDNPLLSEAVRGALVRLARARWLEASTPERRDQHRDEHRAIARALRERDVETATRRAREHGRGVRDHLLDALAGDRARGLRVVGTHDGRASVARG
ncbi:GntR family transcriptional regulator [Lysinimonas soli]|uniref:GntR family transcriptional regulator n=1 Tax=Lysinimonas soli TaxID=1074233 RepID=A0ABW0NRK1_9MICO